MDNSNSATQVDASNNRLDSWKAIAAYLNRDIRTLRRWEQEEALPVHRHHHAKMASVYAIRPELDAWLEDRDPTREIVTKQLSRNAITVAVGTLIILISVSVGVLLWHSAPQELPFEDRHWVLITDFNNHSRDVDLDDTLRYALERELSGSQIVNVVPRSRLEENLRLMRQPPDTFVDAEIGREIGGRDSTILAMLTGRVEEVGETYVLTVYLDHPTNGTTIVSLSEQARGKKEILSAIARLCSKVQGSLAAQASTILSGRQELARVTTRSLDALKLYSQADALMRNSYQGHMNSAAATLLKQALEADPEFASAYNLLSYAVSEREDKIMYSARAEELHKTVTESEGYFIRGTYYDNLGEVETGLAMYEMLHRISPSHYWGAHNLFENLVSLGRTDRALQLVVQQAAPRPDSFTRNVRAAYYLSNWDAGGKAQALPYLQKARDALARGDVSSHGFFYSWLQLLPPHEHWVQGNVDNALRELDRVRDALKPRSRAEVQLLAILTAQTYASLGRLQQAEEILLNHVDAPQHHSDLGRIAELRGDEESVRHHMLSAPPSFWQLLYFAGPGGRDIGRAEEVLATLMTAVNSSVPDGLYRDVISSKIMKGLLAYSKAQTAEAIALLEDGLKALQHTNPGVGSYYFSGSEALALALTQQGSPQRALRILKEAAHHGRTTSSSFGESGLAWLKVLRLQCTLLKQAGRVHEAEEVEAELRRLLSRADPDYYARLTASFNRPFDKAG